MAWGVPKLGTIVDDATGNFDLIEPSGVAEGDLMIACIAMKGSVVVTPPTGWAACATQQNSGDTDATDGIASGAMFYIVRGSGAPSLTFTRTAGDTAYGRIISYTGCSSTPLDVGSAATQGSAGATPTTASLTTAEDGELIVAMVAFGDQYTVSAFDAATDPTTASGALDTASLPTAGTWIERSDSNTATGADTGLGIADAIRASAGATGTIQCTVSSASGRNVMMAAAFKLNHTFSQTESAFYEDGSEAGSTVISAGADSITRDLTSGDSNLLLRVRLQETAGSVGSATDDYKLQYELNDSGTWNSTGVTTTPGVVDSYNESNQSTTFTYGNTSSSASIFGQTFTGDGSIISSVKFYIAKRAGITGNIFARIYAHSGTFGTSGVPTGSVLASSTAFDASTLTTSLGLAEFSFTSSNKISLDSGTKYVVVIDCEGTSSSLSIDVGVDNSSPSHAGNYVDDDPAWTAYSGIDAPFYVNGTPHAVNNFNSASLTNDDPTTNRLGSGTVLSYIAQNAAQADNVTPGTHAIGDVLVAYAFRDGSTTPPTVPAGWTTVGSNTGTLCSSVVAWKVASSAAETSGTWTNASALTIHTYRGQYRGGAPVLNSAGASGTGTTVDYSGIGAMTDAGVSWVARFAGHTSIDTSLQTAPSGHTNRSNAVGATCEVAGHDSNGVAVSSSFGQVAAGGTSGNWLTKTLEILSGKFTAGEISEDGLVDNYAHPAGTFTEHLYALTLESSVLADNDTIDFRVLRNGATTGMTYTVVPRITVDINSATAALTGTVTNDSETDIVAGGSTIILTLTGDTFIAAGTGPIGSTANTQALIDGITSAHSEANGWNNVVKPGIETTDVVRTSNTVATITLDAEATYNITATETITATIPAAVLTGGVQIVASPTFQITPTVTTRNLAALGVG